MIKFQYNLLYLTFNTMIWFTFYILISQVEPMLFFSSLINCLSLFPSPISGWCQCTQSSFSRNSNMYLLILSLQFLVCSSITWVVHGMRSARLCLIPNHHKKGFLWTLPHSVPNRKQSLGHFIHCQRYYNQVYFVFAKETD